MHEVICSIYLLTVDCNDEAEEAQISAFPAFAVFLDQLAEEPFNLIIS